MDIRGGGGGLDHWNSLDIRGGGGKIIGHRGGGVVRSLDIGGGGGVVRSLDIRGGGGRSLELRGGG